MTWEIVFFEDRDGNAPVLKWLDSQPDEVRGKLLAAINKLQQHGPTLPFPYSSQIEGKMRELRTQMGKDKYRVLYFFDENRAGVLLHGFQKNTAAVEESDKKIGRSRIAEHNDRLARQVQKSPKKK